MAIYTQPSISGYNASPPPDDGSSTSANELTWAKHKDKLADPIKTYVEAVDANVLAAFDRIPFIKVSAKTSDYTLVNTDRGSLISVTNTTTITTSAAASAGLGWMCGIRNAGTGTVTLDGNGSETINGAATLDLLEGHSFILESDGTNWVGIICIGEGITTTATEINLLAGVSTLTPTPTESAGGSPEIATQVETDTGTDDVRYVTPLKLSNAPVSIGAGDVGQTEIANSAVGQGELKTATSDVGTTSTTYANLTMTGGSYSFWPRVANDNAGIYTSAKVAEAKDGTTDVTNIALLTESGSWAAHAHSTYVAASPPHFPFHEDDQVYQFVYLGIDKTTNEVKYASSGIDPIWVNNGPTLVNPYGKLLRYAGIEGNFFDYCDDPGDLNDFIEKCYKTYKRIQKLEPKKIHEIMYAPMSRGEKNQDMHVIPHPFLYADLTNIEVILVDPCGLFNEKLHALHLFSGEKLSKIALKQHFIIDNTPQKIKTPKGLKAYGARFKNTK